MGERANIPEDLLPKIVKGAEQAVRVCANVKKEERVVIVQDKSSEGLTPYFYDQIKEIGADLKVIEIENYGERPLTLAAGKSLTSKVAGADVAFICTRYYQPEFLTFLRHVTDLTNSSDIRLVLVFDLDERTLSQGLNADYEKIRELTHKLHGILRGAKTMRVTTGKGTDFTALLGYNWIPLDGFPKPRKWVNLPDGEILTSPKDLNGRIVVDGVVEEFDKPKFGILEQYPLEMEVVNGRIALDSVFSRNQELVEFILANLRLDENANRIGELALGTNIFLEKLIGNLTQDEKFPSVHIAWGDPYGDKTGADWTSKQHMDAVILETTVEVDGRKIMERGKYLI